PPDVVFGSMYHSGSHGHTLLCSSGLKVEQYSVAHARAPYCKNLTSVADGHVVQVLRALREIGRRIDAGEGLEVMYEVRLIEVAARQGHVRPLDLLRVMNAPQ